MSQHALVISPAITIVDGKPTTLSTDMARHFGKRHDNVMQTISALRAQVPSEHLLDFQEVSVEVEAGQGAKVSYPAYRLSRDGFTLSAMGFTGKKALTFKLAYIDAFNRMETELQQQPAQDTQRLQLAQRTERAHLLASKATAQVFDTVFQAAMRDDFHPVLDRILLSLHPSDNAVPQALLLERNAIVTTVPHLIHAVASDLHISTADLTHLALACTQRLAARTPSASQQGNLQLR